MKQTQILFSVGILLLAVGSFSTAVPQRTRTPATIRRIPVNARTISALGKTRNYVVDLTRKGVKYEFDPKQGQIDFNRVTIRTDQGDLTLAAFLEKSFSKETLSGFKADSHSFILGTRPNEPPPSDVANAEARLSFSCGSISCDCVGDYDCGNLVFRSGRCKSMIFCWIGDDGKTHCHCRQHP